MTTLSPHIPTHHTPSPSQPAGETSPAGTVEVEVVIPVYNEQRALRASVITLHQHMSGLGRPFQITIADNASADETLEIARQLARELDHVSVLHLDQKGRGRALRAAWSTSGADVVAYMDVDLSTDLSHVRELIEPLLSGAADVSIGTRLDHRSNVRRSFRRELISRSYNAILHAALGAQFSDAQCGFKAATHSAVRQLLPDVHDDAWFFDTELLFLAERAGMEIHEVPVRWVEDSDSRVNIIDTAREDLRGIRRLRRAERCGRRAGVIVGADESTRSAGQQGKRERRRSRRLGDRPGTAGAAGHNAR